jgi:NTP pyrophosphatase (non-canonical NTP hydrolase)
MKDLIEANYKSIVDRGLIAPSTNYFEFIDKLDEEVKEFKYALEYFMRNDKLGFKPMHIDVCEELSDVIMVCLNFAKHYNIDIEQEIKNKIEVNKQRAKNEKK